MPTTGILAVPHRIYVFPAAIRQQDTSKRQECRVFLPQKNSSTAAATSIGIPGLLHHARSSNNFHHSAADHEGNIGDGRPLRRRR